jgi:hypothetical protein
MSVSDISAMPDMASQRENALAPLKKMESIKANHAAGA